MADNALESLVQIYWFTEITALGFFSVSSWQLDLMASLLCGRSEAEQRMKYFRSLYKLLFFFICVTEFPVIVPCPLRSKKSYRIYLEKVFIIILFWISYPYSSNIEIIKMLREKSSQRLCSHRSTPWNRTIFQGNTHFIFSYSL